jgi:hypothetical protein
MPTTKEKRFEIDYKAPTISLIRVCDWLSENMPPHNGKCKITIDVKIEADG